MIFMFFFPLVLATFLFDEDVDRKTHKFPLPRPRDDLVQKTENLAGTSDVSGDIVQDQAQWNAESSQGSFTNWMIDNWYTDTLRRNMKKNAALKVKVEHLNMEVDVEKERERRAQMIKTLRESLEMKDLEQWTVESHQRLQRALGEVFGTEVFNDIEEKTKSGKSLKDATVLEVMDYVFHAMERSEKRKDVDGSTVEETRNARKKKDTLLPYLNNFHRRIDGKSTNSKEVNDSQETNYGNLNVSEQDVNHPLKSTSDKTYGTRDGSNPNLSGHHTEIRGLLNFIKNKLHIVVLILIGTILIFFCLGHWLGRRKWKRRFQAAMQDELPGIPERESVLNNPVFNPMHHEVDAMITAGVEDEELYPSSTANTNGTPIEFPPVRPTTRGPEVLVVF